MSLFEFFHVEAHVSFSFIYDKKYLISRHNVLSLQNFSPSTLTKKKKFVAKIYSIIQEIMHQIILPCRCFGYMIINSLLKANVFFDQIIKIEKKKNS